MKDLRNTYILFAIVLLIIILTIVFVKYFGNQLNIFNKYNQPIIQLSFDENTGTKVSDKTGYLEDGYINYVFNDAKFQDNSDPQHTSTAIKGNALIFDGYSTYIEYKNVMFEPTSFSCSVWIAPRAFEWGDKGLPSTIISQYNSSKREGFQFGVYRHGSYGLEIYTDNGKIKIESKQIEDYINTFEWTQLAFTYDNETGTVDLYRNGELKMSESISKGQASNFKPSSKSLLIGKNNEGAAISVFNANMFDGVMDELLIFNHALNESDIQKIYSEDLQQFDGMIPKIKYEEISLNSDIIKNDINRPTYHIGAPQNWMNEPHGAFYYNGYYHIFYQHNPFGPYWHQIHWGHLVSTDMIHWKSLPDALSPSHDSVAPDGIWSGSTVLDRDGNPVIFFTAGDDSNSPNQNVATARPADLNDPYLTEWVMSTSLTVKQIQGQGKFGEFRDPYVWYDEVSDYYYMLVGTGTEVDGGTALIYKSYNLNDWTYFGPFLTTNYDKYSYLGKVWELPVFMTLTNENGVEKDILLLSPQGTGADIEVYYFLGHFDRDLMKFIPDSETPRKIDVGNGTFTGPSGFFDPISKVNILFTIAQGNRDSWAEYYSGWAHNGGMPIELRLNENNELNITPVQAVESLHSQELVNVENITFKEANEILDTVKSDALDIDIVFSPNNSNKFGMSLRSTDDLIETTKIYYDNVKKGLYVDRLHSSLDSTSKDITGDVYEYNGDLHLRILLDRSLLEIYANNERSLTTRIFPSLLDAKGLSVFSDDENMIIKSFKIYLMESIY